MSRFRADGTLLGTWHFLACPDGVPSYQVTCNEDAHGFEPPILETDGRIILGLSGAYLRTVNGCEVFADRTSVLLLRPGDELRVAHPLGCGDRYTVVEVSSFGVERWTSDEGWLAGPGWDGVADDRIDLQHRGLAAACARGIDDFEAAERALRLICAATTGARCVRVCTAW
jgi:hypothetical protein